MAVPLAVLLIAANVGAVDGLYYHLYKFRLATQPSARGETLTHVWRAISTSFALLVLAAGTPSGGWYWALVATFGSDFVIDLVDVSLEPNSRKPLGGLPTLEYVIHIAVTAMNGAVWGTFAFIGWPLRNAATGLVASAMPAIFVWDARLTAAGAIALAGLELALLARSKKTVAEAA